MDAYRTPDEQFDGLPGYDFETGGLWLEPTQADRAGGARGAIVLNKNLRDDPASASFVLRHEAVHGLTKYAIARGMTTMP